MRHRTAWALAVGLSACGAQTGNEAAVQSPTQATVVASAPTSAPIRKQGLAKKTPDVVILDDAGIARATKHLVDRERSHGLPEEYTFHPINLTVEWRGPEPEVRWVGVRHEQRYRGVPIEGTMAIVWVPDVGEMQLQNDEVVRALTLDISPRVTPEQAIKRHGGTAPEPGTAAVLVIWPVCDPPPEVEDPPPPVCRWVLAYRLDTSDERRWIDAHTNVRLHSIATMQD